MNGTGERPGERMPGSAPPGIFVSYRRRDSAGYAGRLFDALAKHFGDDRVFMDLEIPPGTDFVEHIGREVSAAQALVVLIGPGWLEADEHGLRRLDQPDDFVRLEIATALDRGLMVLPVLVGGARMPRPADLPPELRRLRRQQAIEISDQRWAYDVERVIRALQSVVPPRVATAAATGRSAALVGLAALALGAVLAVGYLAYAASIPADPRGADRSGSSGSAATDGQAGAREGSQASRSWSADQLFLVQHVPDALRRHCAPFDAGGVRAATAAIDCEPGGPVGDFGLFRFLTPPEMEAWWEHRRERKPDLLESRDACWSGTPGVTRHERGWLMCYLDDRTRLARLKWTDESALIYGAVNGTDGDLAGLVAWWWAELGAFSPDPAAANQGLLDRSSGDSYARPQVEAAVAVEPAASAQRAGSRRGWRDA